MQVINNVQGRAIGYFLEDANHGHTYILDKSLNYLGYYSTFTGNTHKMNGSTLYQGNMLSMLLG
jgi:hypothetical protein